MMQAIAFAIYSTDSLFTKDSRLAKIPWMAQIRKCKVLTSDQGDFFASDGNSHLCAFSICSFFDCSEL